MKRILIPLLCLFLTLSCKDNSKEIQPVKEQTISEKIAYAHGYENWDTIEQVKFTFNVDRDTTHFFRSWDWQPKTGDVTMITAADTISYNRNSMDSLTMKADRGFINDKYWLFLPFQLMWDEGLSVSEPVKAVSPLQKKDLNMITLIYSGDGGYTPGDAYDVYFNDSYMIEEWVFRKGNSADPSIVNTFETYRDYNGIKLATEHKRPGTSWNLNFTGIEFKFQE